MHLLQFFEDYIIKEKSKLILLHDIKKITVSKILVKSPGETNTRFRIL